MLKSFLFILLCALSIASFAQSRFNPLSLKERITKPVGDFRDTYQINHPEIPGLSNDWKKTKIDNRNSKLERVDSLTVRSTNEFGLSVESAVYRYEYNNDLLLSARELHGPIQLGGPKIPLERLEYYYDDRGNVLLHLRYYWNLDSLKWDNSYRESFSYINEDQIMEHLEEYWDEDLHVWVPSTKRTFSYNDDFFLSEHIFAYAIGFQLLEGTKSNYYYNDEDEMVSRLDSTKSNSPDSWQPSGKTEIDYNSSHKEIKRITYSWEEDEFVPAYRTLTVYNNKDSISLQTISSANGDAWVNEYQSRFQYDPDGRLIEFSAHHYDALLFQWINERKTTFDYNEFDDILLHSWYNWNEVSGSWVEDDRQEFIYDTQVEGENIAWPIAPVDGEGTFEFNKKLLMALYYDFDENSSNWVYSDSVMVHYSPIVANEEVLASRLVAYPNPANKELWINLGDIASSAELGLYSLDGKFALRTTVSEGKSVSLENVSDGIYFYSILTGNTSYTGKLVVQH